VAFEPITAHCDGHRDNLYNRCPDDDYPSSSCFIRFICVKVVFRQQQLVKISCKFITIRLSYKRKKEKGCFYKTPYIIMATTLD